MATTAAFWDRIAEKYAASPVRDQASYEKTLDRVRAHLKPTDKVLEVGCGTGSTALTLAEAAGHITATDYSPKMIEIAKRKAEAAGVKNVDFAVVDADALGPREMDVVMAFNLLHLAPDPEAMIKEAHGALRPGGLFISKSVCFGFWSMVFGPLIWLMQRLGKAPVVQMMRIKTLDNMIAEAGFDILETGVFPKIPGSRFVVARKRGG